MSYGTPGYISPQVSCFGLYIWYVCGYYRSLQLGLPGETSMIRCESPRKFLHIQCSATITRSNFSKIVIACPLGWGMGCLLWNQIIIYIQLQSLQCCMQYHVILDRILMAIDCICKVEISQDIAIMCTYWFVMFVPFRKELWQVFLWKN